MPYVGHEGTLFSLQLHVNGYCTNVDMNVDCRIMPLHEI